MSTCRIVVAAWVFLVLAALTAPAGATTINSYSFSLNTGWVTSTPDSVTLEGSFTGVVENDGRMNLSGLTSFDLSVTNPFTNPFTLKGALPDLSFFSYNTAAGVSTLSFISLSFAQQLDVYLACVGAATVLSPQCNYLGVLPPSAHATLNILLPQTIYLPKAFSTDFPTLTLVSSVTTVPEPSTGALLLVGLVGLTLTTYWRATTSTAVTKP